MNIDVAITAEALAMRVRELARDIPVCIGGYFDLLGTDRDPDAPEPTLMFDHIEIGDVKLQPPLEADARIQLANGSLTTIAGSRALLMIMVDVFLIDKSDVIAGGEHDSHKAFQLTLTAYYELFGDLMIGKKNTDEEGKVVGAAIVLRYARKEPDLPDAQLNAAIDAQLGKVRLHSPVHLGDLEAALNKEVTLLNFGIAADGHARRVVLRTEIETFADSPATAWRQFFSSPPDFLDNRDFGILIDSALLTGIAEERFADTLKKKQDKIAIVDPPYALWSAGNASVVMTSYVDLIDECPNGLNIGVGLTVRAEISLGNSDGKKQLETLMRVNWDVDDGDVAACVLSMGGFVLPIVLPFLPLGPAIGPGIALGIALLVAGVIADSYTPDSDQFAQPDCSVVSSDDDQVTTRCVAPLSFGDSVFGELVPDELLGHFDGLLLRGTLSALPANPPLVVTAHPLDWAGHLNCNSKSVDIQPFGGVDFSGGSLRSTSYCGVEVLTSDPNTGLPGRRSQPVAFFKVVRENTFQLTIDVDRQRAPAYYAHPYPCQLLIRTSLGARFVDLGIMPPIPPPPDHDELTMALATHCLKAYSGFWHEKLSLEWLVDPPPDVAVMRGWEVCVTGLFPQDRVEVLTADELVAARGTANAAGAVRVRTVLAPAAGNVFIRRVAGPTAHEVTAFRSERHRLIVHQCLLIPRATLRLRGECLELAAIRGAGRRQLVAVTKAGLEVWDHHTGRALIPVVRLHQTGLLGVVPLRDGAVAVCSREQIHQFRVRNDGGLDALSVGAWEPDKTGDQAGEADPVAVRLRPGAEGQDWWQNALPVGPWTAHLEPDRWTVAVYEAGPNKTVRIPFRPARARA